MLQLRFEEFQKRAGRLLCLGAHCDDIEIGCGGTILQLLRDYPGTEVFWVVFSSTARRKAEAINCADLFLKEAAAKTIEVKEFQDGFFPYDGRAIKEYFESLKAQVTPDLVFTHYRHDAHQDHQTINQLTWNTFRDHLIFEYEIPKYESDLGHPNTYIPLEEAICKRKVELLEEAFPSQSDKHWYTDQTFLAVLKLRGIECRAPSGFAEAFHGPKILMG